jgi:hypothetical protein
MISEKRCEEGRYFQSSYAKAIGPYSSKISKILCDLWATTMRFGQLFFFMRAERRLNSQTQRVSEVKFQIGEINQFVIQNVSPDQVRISSKKDNVAGIYMPVFESNVDEIDCYELTGIARGGIDQDKEMLPTSCQITRGVGIHTNVFHHTG